MTDTTAPRFVYGAHSEVGRLRKVLVCAPGLAHNRLTPSNCDDLLFDDVLWVQRAQRDHFDFVTKMRERGVEVVELHNLLTQILANPEAKAWLLDRKIIANEVGLGLVTETRAFLDGLEPRALARYLIGGLSTSDLPDDFRPAYIALAREKTGVREYLMPPLPNTLYTRDTTCWIYGGVTLNPLYWPARHDETLLMKAVYAFHPDGSIRWTYRLRRRTLTGPVAVKPDGTVYCTSGRLFALDANGALLWKAPVPIGGLGGAPVSLLKLLSRLDFETEAIFTEPGSLLEFARELNVPATVVPTGGALYYSAHARLGVRGIARFVRTFPAAVRRARQELRTRRPDVVHVNFRTALRRAGRGLKRSSPYLRRKSTRRRNPTSGLKFFPTSSTSALAP